MSASSVDEKEKNQDTCHVSMLCSFPLHSININTIFTNIGSPQPGEMSLEEIEQRLCSLIKADTISQLKSSVWKERLEGSVFLSDFPSFVLGIFFLILLDSSAI